MDSPSYPEVVKLVRGLSLWDKRCLLEFLQQEVENDLGQQPRQHWSELRGMFPNLLDGEDAQEWVSRNRREDQDHRDRLLGPHS